MRDKLKDNKFRVIYTVVCVLLCVASYFFQKTISENQAIMLAFSYYASVATLIALIIAVMEIIYAIRISKSTQKKMQERIDWFKNQTVLHLSHECSSYYESSLDDLANKQYEQLSLNFRFALKLHRNIANNFVSSDDRAVFKAKADIINQLEKNIQDTRYISPQEKLTNKKSREIRDSIMEIKSMIDSKHTFTNREV
ncbi:MULTISPECIES: hypothetical protein [unclassified Citrobacter]|uniref:hypothetical protein n=1 Tax=unclassified Citrobacter TaxID=2644389 RepID=UPI002578DA48|nr:MULTISPECIES: hypothetical protein [unclassified Citrobacter]MDM2999090.1 hypothetical protein [Citrobacter sp. CK192]MDM3013353.1 hypothetical protein [Citrobacter sp. CK187]MDM3022553.1 hypothetical protein [Citrobacter sp. CK193]